MKIDAGEQDADGADVHFDCDRRGWELHIKTDVLPRL